MIALVTPSCASVHATATAAWFVPRDFATLPTLSTISKLRSVSSCALHRSPDVAFRRLCRTGSRPAHRVLRVLPGQHAHRPSGDHTMHAETVALRGRQDVAFDVPDEQ